MSELCYRMDSIPRSEFDRLYGLVLATAASRRSDTQIDSTLPRLVTDDVEQLPQSKQGYVRQSLSTSDHLHGAAWTGIGYIWINPNRRAHEIKRTILHELSHLMVANENHGPKWRRLFGMSLVHYCKTVSLLQSEIRNEVAYIVARYHKQRSESTETYHESLRNEARSIITTSTRQHKEIVEAVAQWQNEQQKSSRHLLLESPSTGTVQTSTS